MSGRRAALCLALTTLAAVNAGVAAQSQATFRTTASAVTVPVSVREGNRAVAGLASTDFALADNDVAQDIEALSIETIPVDVTLVVDTSQSTLPVADRLEKSVQQIARLLRPGDGFRVMTIDTLVGTVGTNAHAPVIDKLPRQNGTSSVHDALIAALVRPVATDRRHLVVAITDLLDTISFSTADRVREVASRSEALLEIMSVRIRAGSSATRAAQRPRYNDLDTLILAEAAERTGGELRGPGLFGDADPVVAFKRVFDDFRQSYVLRYQPRGVEPTGWHELAVSVPKAPNATVRARKGYYGS